MLDFEQKFADLYEFYSDGLAGMKVWPMDVMCYEVTKGLLEGEIEPINCTHLIVDEYQDTDRFNTAGFAATVSAELRSRSLVMMTSPFTHSGGYGLSGNDSIPR